MAIFQIEVQQTITTTVEVRARNLEGAVAKAIRRDFPLPPRDEWENIGWTYQAPVDDDGHYDPEGQWEEM